MMQQPPADLPILPRCALAKISYYCGLAGFLLGPLAGIPAVVCGHVALARIKKSVYDPIDRVMASRGLILGYINTFILTAVVVLLIGGVLKARSLALFEGKSNESVLRLEITQIEMAFQNFYDEYGSLPSNKTSDSTFYSDQDTDMFEALLGENKMLQPKSIKFLTMKTGKDGKNGVIYDPISAGIIGIYDPWGGVYKVRLDLDYDEKIEVNGEILMGRRVAVWSDGPDQIAGTIDDVMSWK